MKEYIKDAEKRLLFSALTREKKICKKLYEESSSSSKTDLVPIVESLENKFYYDKMIKQIRKDTVEEFVAFVLEGGISEDFANTLRNAANRFS